MSFCCFCKTLRLLLTVQTTFRYAERANRSIKRIITRFIQTQPDTSWEETIEKATYVLNHRYNRSIKMAPAEVVDHWQELNQRNRALSRREPFDDFLKEQQQLHQGAGVEDNHHTYKLGDTVVLPLPPHLLQKESDRYFSFHLYTIKNIKTEERPFLYQLADGMGNVQKRWYSAREMRGVKEPSFFPVSSVKGTEMRGGRKYVKVGWVDYNDAYDTWIPASDLRHHI